MTKRALLSVYDKSGVVELAGGHAAVGPRAAVAAGLGLGCDGKAGTAYCLAELLVARAASPP